jgi:hypothetical protein
MMESQTVVEVLAMCTYTGRYAILCWRLLYDLLLKIYDLGLCHFGGT